jgi:hypothetical protein
MMHHEQIYLFDGENVDQKYRNPKEEEKRSAGNA